MQTILIFAGGDLPQEDMVDDIPVADTVIAADGGYDIAVALGYRVDVLVGDMDSIEAVELPNHVLVERHPTDKAATDLELALELAVRETPDRVVIVGGSGGRFDHEIALATLLCSRRWSEVGEIDWLSTRGRGHVIWGRRLIHGDVGDILTLIPMNGPALGIHTKGLHWNLDGAVLEPGSTVGVSNRFVSPVADVKVGQGCLLALLASSPQDR